MRLKLEMEKMEMEMESHIIDECPMIESKYCSINSKRYLTTVPIPKT